jgi:hypothetical protein
MSRLQHQRMRNKMGVYRLTLIVIMLLVCSCGGAVNVPIVGNVGGSAKSLPPMGTVTVRDLSAFLDQTVCDDGSVDFTRCGAKHRQSEDEVARYRRHDLPAPGGYQIGDCVDERCIFSYPPFGPFNVANGDGGDHYTIDRDGIVRIDLTQDGSKPGILQHFVGPDCGGDGWVVFRQDAPTGRWAEMVARLSNTNDGRCPSSLGSAYTRWRLEQIPWTLYFGQRPTTVTLLTIISEHYEGLACRHALAAP